MSGVVAGLFVCLASCSGDATAMPPVTALVASGRHPPPTEVFEVWVCDVGPTDEPLYADDGQRFVLDAPTVAQRIGDDVSNYWATVSHGNYRPTFAVGGTVSAADTGTSQSCIDRALAASGAQADAVLVVADAQHAADQPGGRSSPGSWLECTDQCAAQQTGRFVYVGANDFAPALADAMPLDLIEHEMGHSLGLPHSGDAVGAPGNRGAGPYDVMADSASPRQVDPSRRDGPDLLGIDRLALGWLPADDVAVVTGDDTVTLSTAAGADGARLMVIGLDQHRALTAELLVDTGYDDHLPHAGVVVHLLDDSAGPYLERVQQVVATTDGATLLVPGDLVTVGDRTIAVDTIDAGADPVTHLRTWRVATNPG
jgi:hypothetical protein